jgi:hypothetical protein
MLYDKVSKFDQKNISEISNILPISIQLLTVFPVNKIDREKGEKTIQS